MNEPTALAEAQHPTALNRRGEARHADDRVLCREMHHLEAIEPIERLERDTPLYADVRRQVSEIDIDSTRMIFDHPTEPSGQKRGRGPEVL